MVRIGLTPSSMYGFDLRFCLIDFMICVTDFMSELWP